jgi:hypothetical protein
MDYIWKNLKLDENDFLSLTQNIWTKCLGSSSLEAIEDIEERL